MKEPARNTGNRDRASGRRKGKMRRARLLHDYLSSFIRYFLAYKTSVGDKLVRISIYRCISLNMNLKKDSFSDFSLKFDSVKHVQSNICDTNAGINVALIIQVQVSNASYRQNKRTTR